MLRLVLLGCGSHSRQQHAAPLARYAARNPGQIALAAACDLDRPRAERVCAEFGFARAYASLEQMLDTERPDACVAVVPVPAILPTGRLLLERGLPCLLEKPPGQTLAEVRELAAVARRTGTPHQVSVNRRFVPFLDQALAWARPLGPLRYVRVVMARHNRREPEFIWSTGIHALDAARHLAGDIAAWQVRSPEGHELASRWYSVSLQFSSGALGEVLYLPTCGHMEESYELAGEGYRALVSSRAWEGMTRRCWRDNRLVDETAAPADEPVDITCGAYAEVEAFVRALQTGVGPGPTLDDVLPSAEVCFGIADGARAGNGPAAAG